MTLLPALAVAATMVYWLSGFISQYFSELATQIIDLLLFVVIMVAINTLLKNWRGIENVPTAIHRMVDACRKNSYAPLIARMTSGWAVLGTAQFLRGYSLLLPDPVVPHLNAMQAANREQFLNDMASLGDAVLRVTGALRINYAMFGNAEPALHAHVVPRYIDEAPELSTAHPWGYDWAAAPQFDPQQHADLLHQLRAALQSVQG